VPNENVADYYRRRAEADVGLIITEGVGIDHPAALGKGAADECNVPRLHGEDALAGWKRVVDAVHSAGGVIFPQLWHMGPMRINGTGDFADVPSCRPSGLWGPKEARHAMPPHYMACGVTEPTSPMSESDIADVIGAYGRSAANAREVGFDGIAIHGAHGYLIDSFFWNATNLRTDRWGSDSTGRTRLGAEVIREIRKAVGNDLPVIFRFSQWKQQDFDARLAHTPQELGEFLQPLVDAGVDLFDVSTRVFKAPAFEDSKLTLAGWTRKVTGKPTMCVGSVGLVKDLYNSFAGGSEGVNNLDEVVSRFNGQEFDLVGVGRALLVDPDWARKARTGRTFEPFSLDAVATLF
jgi:2,4-dienoyl-CoA reductase-like NADH-dependent reductase (Old Yellow Enzyme family)